MEVPKEYFFDGREEETFYDDNVFRVVRATVNDDIHTFRMLQFDAYEGNENWIPWPPHFFEFLFSSENPFRRHADADLLFVYKQGKPVGTVVVCIDDRLSERYNKRIGTFGFFELLDHSANNALIVAMERRFKDNYVEEIRGPINLSMEYNAGFLLYPHDQPAPVFVNYTKPEYPKYFEDAGYEPLVDLVGLEVDLTNLPEEAIKKAKSVLTSGEYEFRNVSKKNRDEDLKTILNIVLEAFKEHWAFAKKDIEDLWYSFYPFKDLVDERMARIVYHEGKPVGFTIRIPDYGPVFRKLRNRLRAGKFGIIDMIRFVIHSRKLNRGKTIGTGILEGFRRRGLATTLNYLAIQRMLERKFKRLDYSWIVANNEASIKCGKKWGGVEKKRRRVYKKPL